MQQANSQMTLKLAEKKHKKVLNKHLKDFFRLLDSKPKPTDAMVRSQFIQHEAEWRVYCLENSLGAHIADLFNANVSLEWERKYAQPREK